MPRLILAFALAFLLPFSAFGAEPLRSGWEIQVVAGEDCGACSVFRDFRERREIGEVLETKGEHLPDRVPVRVIAPAELTEDDFRRMDALPYLDEGKAREMVSDGSLLVVVRYDGRVMAAGNIARSTPLPTARFPASVMDPPASGPFEEETRDPWVHYERFFLEHWSLEHFLELAKDPSLSHPDSFSGAYGPSKGAGDIELAPSNVLLVGSASTPAGNPLFIPERMREIRDALIDAGLVPSSGIQLFFGDGGGDTNDTSVETDGKLGFRPVNLGGERSLNGQALVDWFTALREQDTRRNLIVQVGHGAPWGMPVWGHLAALSPDELRAFHEKSGARNVIVSGACFGGIFAESASCGFFAARPDVVAAGCQRSPDAIAESDDYLRWYFRSLGAQYRDDADADGDGRISFREAHWFAATRLEHDQIPYTTLDARADRYFEENPSALPVSLTPGALKSLASGAPPAEKAALDRFIEEIPDGRAVNLTDPAGQKQAVAARLRGLAHAGSAERNEAMALPYRLALVQLARRLVFRDVGTEVRPNERHIVDNCEARTIADYLQ